MSSGPSTWVGGSSIRTTHDAGQGSAAGPPDRTGTVETREGYELFVGQTQVSFDGMCSGGSPQRTSPAGLSPSCARVVSELRRAGATLWVGSADQPSGRGTGCCQATSGLASRAIFFYSPRWVSLEEWRQEYRKRNRPSAAVSQLAPWDLPDAGAVAQQEPAAADSSRPWPPGRWLGRQAGSDWPDRADARGSIWAWCLPWKSTGNQLRDLLCSDRILGLRRVLSTEKAMCIK